MKLVPSTCVAVLASLLPSFAAVNLAGKILQPDSLPKQGVVVSLSGTTLSDTTNAAGEWSLIGTATGVVRRTAPPQAVSNHLVLRNGRIQLALAGRDVFGRNAPSTSAIAPVGAFDWGARSTATSGFDTLVYSWNGKTILRDTVSSGALERTGIVRHFDTTVNPAIVHGYLADDQNHFYRTVTIGNQVWMAENLNYKLDSSWCSMDSASLCPRYGRLYNWSTLFGVFPSYNHSTLGRSNLRQQGLCPSGWRIPSDSDFTILLKQIDSARSGILLRSTQGWVTAIGDTLIPPAVDTFGFNAPASGYRNSDGTFANLHTHVAFWTTTESDMVHPSTGLIGSFVWTGHFYVKNDAMIRLENYKDIGLSVRCIEGAGLQN